MTTSTRPDGSVSSGGIDRHHSLQPALDSRVAPGEDGLALGGNTLARIVEENCPDMQVAAGVVIEHLDAQAGAWEFSTDQGQSWRAVRTDLINRAGNMGLALDRDARLRVLPFGGHRVTGARVAFHTVQRSHGQGNGSYRAYADEERDGGSRTVTLVLSLSSINGVPPAVYVPRPRNKRAMAQRAASTARASISGALALS
ncbi:hypothetical protein [Acidovorax radicis]|uniref:hypothetical protein n=1 Tax=Acidovorax radicis TaxID=758826 RepID=UPI001CFB91BE|nr:hypothetical protein [Acidovorax radicis]UCV00599.1 hypothetical protein KI609_07535 [Acidovorax radicis]